MPAITAAQLRAAAPGGNQVIIDAIASTSAAVFAKYGIGNRNRVWGFLSTCYEESGGFRTLAENDDYTAERAHEVWPRLFPTVESAAPYAHNPRALADRVYGGRMGDAGPDAGWLYRGEGLDQVTGEDNFALLQRLTGLPLVARPELVTTPEHMLECAVALFVQFPSILIYCDRGAWRAVWALVGSGRASGPVINLGNHEAALAAIQRAIPSV